MAKRGRPKKIRAMQIHLPKEVQSPERPIKKAAKRGRPTKADANLKWVCDRLESIVKKQNEEIKGIQKSWREADAEVARLTTELEDARKTAEDRLLSGQVMARQIAKAEEEIRIYEREHRTLRQIILDGLRRD